MRKIILIIIFLLLFISGFVAGKFAGNIPLVQLDYKMTLGDISNFLIAIFIAIVIPLSINSWLDDKRKLKDFLMDEVGNCVKALSVVRDTFDECYKKGKFKKEDRKNILLYFRRLDISIDSLINQIEMLFKNKGGKVREEIKNTYIKYWKKTTGGALMSDGFKVDYDFVSDHYKNYFEFEIALKRAVHKINNF